MDNGYQPSRRSLLPVYVDQAHRKFEVRFHHHRGSHAATAVDLAGASAKILRVKRGRLKFGLP